MEANFVTEPARQTPVTETDVFVAGAGTAGCIAAIAAARAGAKVILAEKLPVPGGTLTNGGIGISNYYASSDGTQPPKRIVGGIPYELACRLEEALGATGFLPAKPKAGSNPYRIVADHEIYKGVISEMLLEAGVTVLLSTLCCGVRLQEERGTEFRISHVFLENKDGRCAIAAKQFIDATGDGDLAHMAGLPQEELWTRYHEVCGGPTGLVFGMGGVDLDRFEAENPAGVFPLGHEDTPHPGVISKRYAFVHTRDSGKYAPFRELDLREFTSIQSIHPGELTYINNSKGPACDVCSARELSRAEMESRIGAMKFADAMRRCVPGCEKAYLSWASVQMGVRASRITLCDRMLTQQEIASASRFPDEIGLYGFHDLAASRPQCAISPPGYYGMPYGMLLPRGCGNLFMAGRCVTLDLEAHMSTRNTVGCMVMGQGAGAAAALCAARDCASRRLNYDLLRDCLKAQDVIF